MTPLEQATEMLDKALEGARRAVYREFQTVANDADLVMAVKSKADALRLVEAAIRRELEPFGND